MNQSASVYRILFTAAVVLCGIVAWMVTEPSHVPNDSSLCLSAVCASHDGRPYGECPPPLEVVTVGAEDTTPARYASQPENAPGLVLSEQLRRAFAVDGAGNREKAACDFLALSQWSLADPLRRDIHTRRSLTSLHIRLQV
jgi:hypothetical protein